VPCGRIARVCSSHSSVVTDGRHVPKYAHRARLEQLHFLKNLTSSSSMVVAHYKLLVVHVVSSCPAIVSHASNFRATARAKPSSKTKFHCYLPLRSSLTPTDRSPETLFWPSPVTLQSEEANTSGTPQEATCRFYVSTSGHKKLYFRDVIPHPQGCMSHGKATRAERDSGAQHHILGTKYDLSGIRCDSCLVFLS